MKPVNGRLQIIKMTVHKVQLCARQCEACSEWPFQLSHSSTNLNFFMLCEAIQLLLLLPLFPKSHD
jgi:hypothetical protein